MYPGILVVLLYHAVICLILPYEVLALVDSDGCGETKGCFMYPADCQGTGCHSLVTWMGDGDGSTAFGLKGSLLDTEHYVAIGFSYDKLMGNTDVWGCLQLEDLSMELDHSYNNEVPRLNIPRNTTGGELTASLLENGTLECTFTRMNKMDGYDEYYYDLTADTYYLEVAIGPRDLMNPKLGKHTDIPVISDDKINFTVFTVASGSVNTPTAHKVHGSLMLFGWIGCASIAILCARYYKPMWPSSKLLGQKVWFTFHRTLMVTNVVCFCTAFVVIFVYVSGWVDYSGTSDPSFIHATIGCIVVGLGLTNPILALFRPGPKDDNRWIFNWSHFAVGMSAHLLSICNVYLGMTIMSLPSYTLWIFVGWVCFHFAMEICLEILNCVNRESDAFTSYKMYTWLKPASIADNSVDLQSVSRDPSSSSNVHLADSNSDAKEPEDITTPTAPTASARLAILHIHIAVTLGVVIYMMVEVCLM